MNSKSVNVKHTAWTLVIFIIAVTIAVIFLYFDRHNQLSMLFQSWGAFGVLLAVILMTIVSVTPMPAEGLLIVLLKVYGVWFGVLYAWFGAILSSFIVFEVARRVGKPLLQSAITPERFEQVDLWVKKRGPMGLLMARLLPIPGFIVSYIVGTIPSVSRFSFVWTGAVAVIPYYVGAACVYQGVSKHIVMWISVGAAALVLFWAAGYFVRRKYNSNGTFH